MISISIIIPVYKVELHIERCLRSVMRQDYIGPLECILVDDCGGDRSMDIARALIADYHGPINFSLLAHKQNCGLSAARNTGVDHAMGDYVFFLDSDDEISYNAISLLAGLAEKYPGVDIVCGDYYTARELNIMQLEPSLPEYTSGRSECKWLIWRKLPVSFHNRIMRLAYLVENNIRCPEGLLHEDQMTRYLLSNTAQSVALCHVPTYLYFVNANSIIHTLREKNVRDTMTIARLIVQTGDSWLRFIQAFELVRGAYLIDDQVPEVDLSKECYALACEIESMAQKKTSMPLVMKLYLRAYRWLLSVYGVKLFSWGLFGYWFGLPYFVTRKFGLNTER